jgi:hypothetical protein
MNSDRDGVRPAPLAMAAREPRMNSLSDVGFKGPSMFTGAYLLSKDNTMSLHSQQE